MLSAAGEDGRFGGLADLVSISKASATGDVYNLTDSAKLAGTYVAAEAGITLAGGVGAVWC